MDIVFTYFLFSLSLDTATITKFLAILPNGYELVACIVNFPSIHHSSFLSSVRRRTVAEIKLAILKNEIMFIAAVAAY